MENITESIMEKISSYNIFNNLLPGAIYCFLVKHFLKLNIISENILESLFLFYFVGMIISRIGSLVIEPILKLFKFVKFAEYKDYVIASSKDEKIDILSEVNNTYRTMVALSLSIIGTDIYIILLNKYEWVERNNIIIFSVLIFIIFLVSYRKQTKHIKNRIASRVDKDEKTKDI